MAMRLFIAVWPPAEVVGALAVLPRPTVPGVRWTGPAQWHVTLRFLGEVDVPPALPASVPPATAVLGPVTVPLGAVLAAPVAGLDELAGAVGNERGFTGHLTLARSRGRGRTPASLAGAPIRGSWEVREVTL